MKLKKLYKSIQYGYPSSDMAAYFGRSREGVYYVAVSDNGDMLPTSNITWNEGLAIAGFRTISEAIVFAMAIQADWHRYSLYRD